MSHNRWNGRRVWLKEFCDWVGENVRIKLNIFINQLFTLGNRWPPELLYLSTLDEENTNKTHLCELWLQLCNNMAKEQFLRKLRINIYLRSAFSIEQHNSTISIKNFVKSTMPLILQNVIKQFYDLKLLISDKVRLG